MRLIDDIIDISKIEAGQIRINPTFFNLSGVFKDLITLFEKTLLRNHNTRVSIIADHKGINPDFTFYADELRFRQIITNLINNAIKFTEEGEIRFGVDSLGDGVLRFYVSDTGIGIPEDKQSVIFERFRQGHETKDKFYGGTGIGLSISRHLTELMGGEISVKSEFGKGSCFYFTLPYSPAKVEVPDLFNQARQTDADWNQKTILVAEDDESNYLLIREILKRTRVNLIRAKDGIEVVELALQHNPPDLILMDIQLPGRTGYEATKLIKAARPGIPVIAQTAYAMSSEREKSYQSGCDGYLSKPIKVQEFFSLLSMYLD